jgi:uncharacterized membrane protein
MRSFVRFLGPVCLVVGGILLGEALVTGGARFYLLLIVPVFTGTTPLFLLSVVLLVVGFLLLPLVFASTEPPEVPSARAASTASPPAATPPTSGGILLVGPIPIFFGAWRRNPPIPYRWALLVGVALAVVAVLLLWGLGAL